MQLVNREHDIQVFDGGKMVGYVEERILFGINQAGYAEEIGEVTERNEIIPKLKEWIETQTR